MNKVDYNVEKAFAALGDAPTDGEVSKAGFSHR